MESGREDFTIAIRSALLKKGARNKFSLFFLISLSIIIIFLDNSKINFMKDARSFINDATYKVSSVATFPVTFLSYLTKKFQSHFFIYSENKILKQEILKFKSMQLKSEFITTQNKKLQEIIKNNKINSGENILAKVLLDKDSPYLKSIIINRGSKSKIIKGMPVLDGPYLIGRVIEVNYLSSRVLLLNDLNSRIPVVIDKSADQAILTGKGTDRPVLEYLPESHFPENNLSVFTSGKDGVFVQGAPIGTTRVKDSIVEIKLFSDPNQISYVSVQISNLIQKDKEE
jgi:rod shape-determining protein MreC